MSKHAMLSNVLFMTQSYLRVRREGRGAHRQTRKGHALLLPQKMPMRQHSFQQESVEPPLKCLRIWSRSGVVLDPVQPEAVHQLQNQGSCKPEDLFVLISTCLRTELRFGGLTLFVFKPGCCIHKDFGGLLELRAARVLVQAQGWIRWWRDPQSWPPSN